jgi:hypothetical protein
MKTDPHQPCRRFTLTNERGSALIAVLFAASVLMIIAGVLTQAIPPAYRTAFESASWQESLQAAEAGGDLAISSIQASAPDPTANPWTGWTNATGSVNGPWTYNGLTAASLALAHAGEGNTNATLAQLTVDVYTRDNNVDIDPKGTPWYRIHSTGRADLPGNRAASLDKRDALLRRMRFNADATHPYTGVTRRVEIIARPIHLLKNAIWSVTNLDFGNSNNWVVDSFNSDNGAYGSTPNTMDANVATNGAFVALNTATIYGTVQTQGGDDHSTFYGAKDASGGTITSDYYENVGGANYTSGGATSANISGVSNVTGLITDDFVQVPTPLIMPSWALAGSSTPLNSASGTGNIPSFTAGKSASTPTYYVIQQNVKGFAVTLPSGLPAGQKAYVNIAINGNLTGDSITLPPNVVAKIYINGNVDFGSGNGTVNASGVAGNLQIYGVAGVTMVNGVPTYTYTGARPYFAMGGGEAVTMTFYGPQYNALFNGGTTLFGSVTCYSFIIKGGGSTAFHYDDALGRGGVISGYEIASFVEDTRLQP